MADSDNKQYRTQNRVLVDADERRNASRPTSAAGRTGHASHAGHAKSAGGKRGSSGRRQPSRVSRPTKQEILRNRIIAVIVLVAFIALVVLFVSCVARAIGGGGSEGESAASASSEASVVASVAQTAAAQSAVPVVPAGEGVEDPWVPGGRFTTGDAELDQLVKDFCDSNSEEGKSAEDNAFNVYCRGMWAEFIERDDNQYPTGPTWDITYAKQILTEGGGNCYEQVALGEYVLKYFGYSDACAEPCLILRQSGEYGVHGLLYVTDKDGRKCLCDPALGANGWMLDADLYTVKVMDVGQDPSEFSIANFEEVVKASWIDA